LIEDSDPFFTMLTSEDSTTELDLNKLEFFFAIEQLEPRFGLVSASYIK